MSLIARLIEAGVPADLIEEVAMLVVEKRALDERRSADRERQQRHRTNVTSRDVTPCHSDPSLSRPPNEKISNPPTHTHPDITTRAREADPFPKPEWADPQHWRDLKANRKAKRLPNTATAHAKLLRDIAGLADDEWPPGRLLEAIVARGWAAAYDPREPANDHRPQRPLNQRETTRQTGERVAARHAAAGGGAAYLLPRPGPPRGDA